MSLETLKSEINVYLNGVFENKGTYNKLVYEAMQYSIKIGGKRIRPLLMLYSYKIYNENYKDILDVACALEMIHTYSLIHDDLPCMDDDDLRRGKPTNHKVYGEAVAVLAGDGLLNYAMSIMFNYCMRKNGNMNSLRACYLICEAAGVEGMIGGQIVDILSENNDISEEQLYYMHKNKTGALIENAIVCGAILAGAPSNDINLLKKYGEKLGLIFQIRDDILDVIGNTETLGKKINSDIHNNKTTFVTKFGLDKCIDICNKLSDECLEILDKLSMTCDALKEFTVLLTKRKA